MAVSDLTGTKWLLNETLVIDSNLLYIHLNLNFSANETNYVLLYFDDYWDEDDTLWQTLDYGSTKVYERNQSGGNVWVNQAYRTIEITGGTDATNSDLISWLEANAEQVIEPAEPLTSSFNETVIVDNSAYLSLYINGVEFKLEKGTPTVTLISFFVEPYGMGQVASFQAESGMTWSSWIASAYNTDGYIVVDNIIYAGASVIASDSLGTLVAPTDEIISNKTYYQVAGGSND